MEDITIEIEELISTVNDVLKKGKITVDDIERDLISDFAFDSLLIVEVIVTLEEKYGIQIDDDDLLMENFSTINDIYQIINK